MPYTRVNVATVPAKEGFAYTSCMIIAGNIRSTIFNLQSLKHSLIDGLTLMCSCLTAIHYPCQLCYGLSATNFSSTNAFTTPKPLESITPQNRQFSTKPNNISFPSRHDCSNASYNSSSSFE